MKQLPDYIDKLPIIKLLAYKLNFVPENLNLFLPTYVDFFFA